MEKVVVDSSIAVKWFVNEPKSKEALNILSKHREKRVIIVVPDIIHLEIINGLFFSYKLSATQLRQIIISLKSLELQFTSINEIKLSNAALLMEKFNIASYDGLFVSLAQELNCPLITNDKKHHSKKMYKKIQYL